MLRFHSIWELHEKFTSKIYGRCSKVQGCTYEYVDVYVDAFIMIQVCYGIVKSLLLNEK